MGLRQEIQKSLQTNIEYGAGRYISPDGILEVTWLPDEKVGYIDIKNPGDKLGFKELKNIALEYIDQLPEAKWEFNPDTPQKGRIYGNLFKDKAIANPDMPNNALIFDTSKKNVDDIVDLSHLTRIRATKEAKRLGVTQYRWKDGQVISQYGGDRWVTSEGLEKRRARERRGGSEELKQLKKEETRIADQNRFRSLDPDEALEVAEMKRAASLEGKDLDHIYGQAYYSEGDINAPSNRAALDPELNRGIKNAQEKGLSQHMLDMELRNPSAGMALEETLDLASQKPKMYQDTIQQAAKAIDDPSIAKHLGRNAGDIYRGASILGIPLVGFLGETVKTATRFASTVPGEYATFGLWKGLDVAVANWSRQDYNEALRQYELNPTDEKRENLNYAERALAFDTGSVVDPTPTSDIAGIANLLTNPGIKKALGFNNQPTDDYVSEWRYDTDYSTP